jgi:putative transposase
MLKAYKYRLYPSKDQQQLIDKTIGCCRSVYNLALEVKMTAYKNAGIKLSAFGLCYQLIELKQAYPYFKEVDSQALQAAVKKVDIAFKNFYNGAGYPKFKSKKKGIQSFQIPNNTRKVDWKNKTISLPKLPNISAVLSRQFTGQIKTCTVTRTPTGKYYISILVDNKKELPLKPEITEHKTMGIDVGVKSFVVSSDGKVFEPNRKLKENLKRLKVLQRRASRKKKGSNNKKKAYLKVAILHERIACKRSDYIHKVTNALICDNQVESIVIEDLNVSGLLQNHKIAQAMSDVSFGQLLTTLQYKCDWYGINLIKIGRFDPSSKRCSCCGRIKQDLSLNDRTWICENCNIEHDRDFNAAVNIKFYGLQQTIFKNKTPEGIWEEPVEPRTRVRTKKQESILLI